MSGCSLSGRDWKSDRQKIRMIVDTRPANAVFRDPPSVALATAETFSKIEINFGEECHLHERDTEASFGIMWFAC